MARASTAKNEGIESKSLLKRRKDGSKSVHEERRERARANSEVGTG
jgi:hypothetical protein